MEMGEREKRIREMARSEVLRQAYLDAHEDLGPEPIIDQAALAWLDRLRELYVLELNREAIERGHQ